MNTITIYNSYYISNNQLKDINVITTKISDLDPSGNLYVTLSFNKSPIKIVNVSFFISYLSNLDYDNTIYNTLLNYLNEQRLEQFSVVSNYTQQSINILDPFTISKMNVAYGNIESPDSYNNETQKPYSRDLIITLDNNINPANTVASVNGVFHKSVSIDNNTVGIVDGYLNFTRSGNKSLMLMNTDNLGGHTIIDLFSNNILNIDSNKTKAYITIENQRLLEDYTVILVVDGSLYTPLHNVYKVLNNSTIVIELNKLNLVKQLRHNPNLLPYNSKPTLAIKTKYPSILQDEDLIRFSSSRLTNTNELNDIEFIKRRLTSTQSFLICVKNKDVFFQKYSLSSIKDPRRYQYYGNVNPNGIFFYNGIHQIPYTITRNLISPPQSEILSDYFKNNFFLSTYMFYVNPYKGGDDINERTLSDTKTISLYPDMDNKRYSANSYLVNISTYKKK